MPKYVAQIPSGIANMPGTYRLFEFESPSLDAAQALCDAKDWQLEGMVKGSTIVPLEDLKRPIADTRAEPKRKAPKSPKREYEPRRGPGNSDRLLTRRQIQTICQLAKTAFDHMDAYGLIEGIDQSLSKSKQCDLWRKMIIKEVTGQDSSRKCMNSEYRKIQAEFLKLGGRKYENPKAYQSGKQSHRKADTMENREQALFLIAKQLKSHHETMAEAGQELEQINEVYVLTIARAQNKDTELVDYDALITLPADVLGKLFYTIRNRCNAKEKKFIS